MHLFIIISAIALGTTALPSWTRDAIAGQAKRGTTGQVPFKYPLPNGFPVVTAATLKAIERQAGGPLPGGGSGTKLSATAAHALQALAFNELFEVAFFTQLLHNITTGVSGYELGDNKATIIAALNSSQAQEELHAYSANEGVMISGFPEVKPCRYIFPCTDFASAMRTADNFAALLIGAIPAVVEAFAAGGDDNNNVTTQFLSVAGQEGQQDGYFRSLQSKIPNANPFMTPTSLVFLYNHIRQHFVVPGSCPTDLGIPSLNSLTPLEAPGEKDSTLQFSTDYSAVSTQLYIAYMSGEGIPDALPISSVTQQGYGRAMLSVPFPFQSGNFSRGLVVAALVTSKGPFANADDVAKVAVAGPGLLQIE